MKNKYNVIPELFILTCFGKLHVGNKSLWRVSHFTFNFHNTTAFILYENLHAPKLPCTNKLILFCWLHMFIDRYNGIHATTGSDQSPLIETTDTYEQRSKFWLSVRLGQPKKSPYNQKFWRGCPTDNHKFSCPSCETRPHLPCSKFGQPKTWMDNQKL